MIRVYREGLVHVLAERCPTCIFRPGNLMNLEAGRVRDMLRECVRRETVIPCHERMDTAAPAVCRGLFDTGQVGILQVAERLGVVVYDD